MSDLIINVQDVYKKWETRGSINFNSRGRRGYYRGSDRTNSFRRDCSDTSSNFQERRYKQRSRAPFFKSSKYENLAQFKLIPSIMSENKQRPFMGQCCSRCVPLSRAAVSDMKVFSLSVCNVLHVPHFQNIDLTEVLNMLKKKQTQQYVNITSEVLKSDGVLNVIESVVDGANEETGNYDENWISNLRTEQFNRAKLLFEYMKSSISSVCLHISSIFLHSILNRMFDGILVHKGQLEILKTASQDNMPIIYMPLCHSQLDCVLISFILFMNSLKVPNIPTDHDLYIPIIRYLLKFLGAFFIRNQHSKCFDADMLYDAILRNYIVESLKSGQNLELLLDKDFTLSEPSYFSKSNLLSIVAESILKGDLDDAYISTVSISYEKIYRKDFSYEQLGLQKENITIFSFLSSIWSLMHGKYGNVRLNFGQPFSTKEFLKSSQYTNINRNSVEDTPPSSPTTIKSVAISECLEDNNLIETTKSLVQHVFYDATFTTSLMSTQLLAFLLVTQYRKGATQQQLQNSMDWLRNQLSNKRRDAGFSGQSSPVIKRAVEYLGKDLISSEVIDMEWTSSDLENNNVKVTIYKPATKLPHILELRYYANQVVPVFLLDSIVVNALYALVDVEICHFRHCDSQLYVSRDKLIDKSIELSNMLQFEFIAIPPCADAAISFSEIIDELIEKECLQMAGVNITSGRTSYTRKNHPLCFDASDDEEDEANTLLVKERQLKVDLSEESISHFEFIRNVLSPYIESYWLASCTLFKLIDEVKEETVFIQEMQHTAQEKLYKGLLAYEESFSAVTFKNSLKLFENWYVIESYIQDGMKIVYLNEHYNNKEMLNEIVARIEEYRK